MKASKRLKTYAAVALGSEVAAVGFALTANLTRNFDNGPLHDATQLFAGAGLVALGMAAENIRQLVSSHDS